jgi:uncharacterized membrane protein
MDDEGNTEDQITKTDSAGNGNPSPAETPAKADVDEASENILSEKSIKKLLISFTKETMTRTRFSGPLPPPEILKGYEDVLPGSAERIIRMTEKQQAHRIQIESSVVEENCRSQRRGLHYGFAISLLVILGGFFLIYEGKNITGAAVVITAVAGLVGVFVYGKVKQSNQLKERKRRTQA